MREYGFTTFSGVPSIAYRGFKDGKPVLDFTAADAQMKTAKELGFLAVVSYGGGGLRLQRLLPGHGRDDRPPASRTTAEFIKAVYTAVQRARRRAGLDSGLLQPGRRADRRRS